MNRKGPLFTLLGGFTLAAILFAASISAANDDEARRTAANGGAVGGAPTTAAATTGAGGADGAGGAGPGGAGTTGTPGTGEGAVGSAPPGAPSKATYAGRVTGGGTTTLAISIHNGKAIAYLCDGKSVEAWYQGTAAAGKLNLSADGGATLTGTYAGGKATGKVTAAGRTWTFTAPTVSPPSGLYRAVGNAAGSRMVGGWIRIDRTQTGMLRRDGVPQSAPPLDDSNSIVVDGATLNASAVDAEAGL